MCPRGVLIEVSIVHSPTCGDIKCFKRETASAVKPILAYPMAGKVPYTKRYPLTRTHIHTYVYTYLCWASCFASIVPVADGPPCKEQLPYQHEDN